MSDTQCELFWAQRYEDGTYHVRVIDTATGLVSGVRSGAALAVAFQQAEKCGQWFVCEWRDVWPDGEQYQLELRL